MIKCYIVCFSETWDWKERVKSYVGIMVLVFNGGLSADMDTPYCLNTNPKRGI
jgi:hypothetical protein